MGIRVVVSVLAAAVLAAGVPAIGGAADAQAPPMLTPLVAKQVAAACPGTATYAQALVRGISEAQAALAAPLFDRCAASLRHDFDDAVRNAASTAVGAAYLSRGLLTHDPAFFQRAIDATDGQRRDARLSEETVRAWSVIPDYFDSDERIAGISPNCGFSPALDATYIYFAARGRTAWITQPREAIACPAPVRSHIADDSSWRGSMPRNDPTIRTGPAIEPGFNSPVLVLGGH
jgi:hypothetical protein